MDDSSGETLPGPTLHFTRTRTCGPREGHGPQAPGSQGKGSAGLTPSAAQGQGLDMASEADTETQERGDLSGPTQPWPRRGLPNIHETSPPYRPAFLVSSP